MKNKYLVFCPDEGTEEFSTLEEAKKYAKSCIESYLAEDSWNDDVRKIMISKLTHAVKQTNSRYRPNNLDEDGFDENGDFWGDQIECLCDFEISKL